MIELLLFAILCVLFPPLFFFLLGAAVLIGVIVIAVLTVKSIVEFFAELGKK